MQKISKIFLQNLAKSLFFELDEKQLSELEVEFNVVIAQMNIIQKINTKSVSPQCYCTKYRHTIQDLNNYPVAKVYSKIISQERVNSENELILPHLKSNDE